MKIKITIILILSIVICAFGQSLDSNITTINLPEIPKFDSMFDMLNKKRIGLSNEQIHGLKNPFLIENENEPLAGKNTQNIEPSHRLTGIIGTRAKINNQWLNIGDSIGSYRVIGVNYDSAIISNETNTIELKLNQGKENVIITYR